MLKALISAKIKYWIMERKWSSGFRRTFTVAFLLFLSPAGDLILQGPASQPWGTIINIILPKITYQKLLWKYDETRYFVFFPWSKILNGQITWLKRKANWQKILSFKSARREGYWTIYNTSLQSFIIPFY